MPPPEDGLARYHKLKMCLTADEVSKMTSMFERYEDAGAEIQAFSSGASFDVWGAGVGVAFFAHINNKSSSIKNEFLCSAYCSIGNASYNYAEYFAVILA